MLKSIMMPALAVTLAAAAWLLLPIRGDDAIAQSGPYLVNAVNLDIVPADRDKFIEAAKENGAASTKDPGCREFNITVAQNDPIHVFPDAAAWSMKRPPLVTIRSPGSRPSSTSIKPSVLRPVRIAR